MSFLGAYLGAKAATVSVTVVSGGPGDVAPIESPYTPADPKYVDHIAKAIDRLCEYAKSGEFEYDPVVDQFGFAEPE